MENDAKKRGIQTTCHDNPAEIQHLLCADFPNSRECQFLASGARNATKSVSCGYWKLAAIVTISIAGILLLAAIIGLINVKTRKKKDPLFNYSHGIEE